MFTGAPELCLHVQEEDVNKIFELIAKSTDISAQAQLMETLSAMMKVLEQENNITAVSPDQLAMNTYIHLIFYIMQIEGVKLTVKRNQALIVKNYCQYCDKFYCELLGEDREKQEARWRIITQVKQYSYNGDNCVK